MSNNAALTFIVGVICGAATYFVIDGYVFALPGPFSTSDLVDLSGIIVNALIGIALVLIIQKKLSDDRGVKDYFQKEVSDIAEEYRKFNNLLFKGKLDTKYAVEWFKHISVRLNNLETFLLRDLRIKNLALRATHREIHVYVTGSVEFNNSFKGGFYSPTAKTKTRVFELYREFQRASIEAILRINRA